MSVYVQRLHRLSSSEGQCHQTVDLVQATSKEF